MGKKEVIANTIASAVVQGVQEASRKPDNDLTQQDVNAVSAPVIKSVLPYIEHMTNTEQWWQSRSWWAALIAALAGVLGVFGYALPEEFTGKFLDLVTAAAPLISAGLWLYARYVAKKPLGS